MNRLCEKNSQELPEVPCTSPYYNIVILAPDSLHWTKKCEKKRSGERNQAHTCLPAPDEVYPSEKTQALAQETSSCSGKEVLRGGAPVQDVAQDVFRTLPGHTSTSEDDGQLIVEGVMRLPFPQTGCPTHA
jgi:hypothetical protein